MTNNKNPSLTLGSFSLAVFILAKLSFLIGLNSSIFMSALVTAGLVSAFISLIISLINSFITPMSKDTKRIVRSVQAVAIIVLIVSLLTGGFGSLLAGYIHF